MNLKLSLSPILLIFRTEAIFFLSSIVIFQSVGHLQDFKELRYINNFFWLCVSASMCVAHECDVRASYLHMFLCVRVCWCLC